MTTIVSFGAIFIISCTQQDIVSTLTYFAGAQITIAMMGLISFFWRMRTYLKLPLIPKSFLFIFLSQFLLHSVYLTAPLFFLDNRLAYIISKLASICAWN